MGGFAAHDAVYHHPRGAGPPCLCMIPRSEDAQRHQRRRRKLQLSSVPGGADGLLTQMGEATGEPPLDPVERVSSIVPVCCCWCWICFGHFFASKQQDMNAVLLYCPPLKTSSEANILCVPAVFISCPITGYMYYWFCSKGTHAALFFQIFSESCARLDCICARVRSSLHAMKHNPRTPFPLCP